MAFLDFTYPDEQRTIKPILSIYHIQTQMGEKTHFVGTLLDDTTYTNKTDGQRYQTFTLSVSHTDTGGCENTLRKNVTR